MSLSRRDAFKLGGLGALGVAGLAIPFGNMVSAKDPSFALPTFRFPKPYTKPFVPLTVLTKASSGVDYEGAPVDRYDQSELNDYISVLENPPGGLELKTPVMGYDGKVPGYRIDVNSFWGNDSTTPEQFRGRRIELTMRNKLELNPDFPSLTSVRTSTHLHGSASLPQYDGYASDTTEPGWKKKYKYPNIQPARTLWYHDHAIHHTGEMVQMGLATQYHLHDMEERDGLPTYDSSLPDGGPYGPFDVGLIISDMMFQANGHQLFDDRDHSGFWGDVILVNGTPWPVMKVQPRIYRFRVLDASISRSYRFKLSNPNVPMFMVATDGGLMNKPVDLTSTSWRHGTAERYELLIDFRGLAKGTKIELQNLSNPNNRDFVKTGKVMRFDVVAGPADKGKFKNFDFGKTLTNCDTMALAETGSMKVRSIRVEHDDVTNAWTLNGHTWDEIKATRFQYVIADPDLGDTEVWEVENKSGGWFHPLHIHLIDFKVLSRNGKAPFAWETGPKDVIYIGEAEKIRLIMKFGTKDPTSPFSKQVGRYMIHCHNLVHEDHDMMSQFSVGLKQTDMDASVGGVETFPAGWVDPYTPPVATDWNHPVKAAPPRPETDPDAP